MSLLERSFSFFQRAAFVIDHFAYSIVRFRTAFFLLSLIFILFLFAKNLFHSDSQQSLQPQWMRMRFVLILESNTSFIPERKGPFANFLILLKKHLGIISNVRAIPLKLKLLWRLKNGDEMCESLSENFLLFHSLFFFFFGSDSTGRMALEN